MTDSRRAALSLLVALLFPVMAAADAIVVTRAMTASTIAEIFVEDDQVRVELEIGAADLLAFANLLPDEIYNRLQLPERAGAERLQTFFESDWQVLGDDGQRLPGQVTRLEARNRIQRDEITGDALAIQPDDAEIVIYAELLFDFDGDPAVLSFRPPQGSDNGRSLANIGFVAYHKGLPVTDFRYLSTLETLDLDWDDPWYSQFRNRNLRRQFDSPISVFLYVEPFEVRKEIVIRPVDLQRWTNLDIDIDGTIPVADQARLKQQVTEFLRDQHPVTIDGQLAEGQLDRIHFIRRTLRKTGVVYPDEDLAAVSATLGVIFVYPIETLPDQVAMQWDLFDERIQSIPASATDEAGGLPSALTPDDPVLVWKNYLTNPTIPAMRAVPVPPQRATWSIPIISAICGLGILLTLAGLAGSPRLRMPLLIKLAVLLVLGVTTLGIARITVSSPLARRTPITDSQAREIVDSLLHNIYHAFDRRDESLVYDQLATSLSGDLLKDVYLQTRRRIRLADQGGAQVKIDEVEIQSNQVKTQSDPGFTCTSQWNASGTVGHWGHLHRRILGYEARLQIAPVEGVWKITALDITDETQPEVAQPGG